MLKTELRCKAQVTYIYLCYKDDKKNLLLVCKLLLYV